MTSNFATEQYFIKNIITTKDMHNEVWLIEVRGHDKSQGFLVGDPKIKSKNMFARRAGDLFLVLREKVFPHYKAEKVNFILAGESMGSHISIRLLYDYPQEAKKFSQVILLAPMLKVIVANTNWVPGSLLRKVSSTFKYNSKWARFLANAEESRKDLEQLTTLPIPITVFLGTNDERIEYQYSNQFAKKMG